MALAALVSACDAGGPEPYVVEVSAAEPIQTEDGRSALRFEVRNTGTAPLESIFLEVQTPPIQDASVGTLINGLGPGQAVVAEVDLWHLSPDVPYDCYRTTVAAFAPDVRTAVVEQAGPSTCR